MPVKEPVKSKYPPLTKEEKRKIIARHKDLVDKFNAILPEGQKVSYDTNLLRKLNDPEVVAVYRIANEMKQVIAQQEEIRAELKSRFGEYQGTSTNPFMRNLAYGFRLDRSIRAKNHNEKTYHDYLTNPNRLAYVRYKNVFKLNPQEIIACKGSPAKLAEYYKKNFTAIKDAWEFANSSRRMDLTPAMKDMADSICDQLNLLGSIEKEIMTVGSTLEYFAYPKITKAQGLILSENPHLFKQLELATGIEENPSFNAYVQLSMEKEAKLDICSIFERINEKGGHVGEGSMTKYKIISKNKLNGHEKDADVGKLFPEANPNQNRDPNLDYTVKQRSDEELKHIRIMTFDASYRYANAWRARFEDRNGFGTFDPDRIESRLKLGFFSSWFGRGNSREYSRLMETYRQFNDPRHKNYLREDLLKEAAVNYRDRKANQGHTGRGNSLDDRRMKFADDVIATCEQCKAEQDLIFRNIDYEFSAGYPQKREPFLEDEDVEEKEYEYKVDSKELEKEIDYSKKVEDIEELKDDPEL